MYKSKILIIRTKLTEVSQGILGRALDTCEQFVAENSDKLRVEYTVVDKDVPLKLQVGTVTTGYNNTPVTSSYISPVGIMEAGRSCEVERSENYDVIFLVFDSDAAPRIEGIPRFSVHNGVYYEGFTIAQTGITDSAQESAVAEIIMHEKFHAWHTLIKRRGDGTGIEDKTHQFGGMVEARPEYNYSTLLRSLEPYYSRLGVEQMDDSVAIALHDRLIGMYVLRAEAKGELYRVERDALVYQPVGITDKMLKKEFDDFLIDGGKMIGIGEKDFAVLESVVAIQNQK